MSITEKQSISGSVGAKQSLMGELVAIPSIDKTLTKEGFAADAKAVGNAIQAHEVKTDNPHNVTKAQVGLGKVDNTSDDEKPVSMKQLEAINAVGVLAKEAKKVVTDHAYDENNPHKVTASQVKARPDDWMPTAAEVKARPDTWFPTAAEVKARPDDWFPKADEVGAAPSGYCLGEVATGIDAATDANTCDKTGWYRIYNETANGVGASAMMRVEAYSHNYIKQTAIRATGGWVQIRYCNNNTWSEWEWETAPMTLGGEYRTTERWQGNPVYTSIVNVGKFVSGGINVETGLTATAIIRYCGVCNRFSIPAVWGNDVSNSYSITASVYIADLTSKKVKVFACGGSNNVNNTVYMQIWYTKD